MTWACYHSKPYRQCSRSVHWAKSNLHNFTDTLLGKLCFEHSCTDGPFPRGSEYPHAVSPDIQDAQKAPDCCLHCRRHVYCMVDWSVVGRCLQMLTGWIILESFGDRKMLQSSEGQHRHGCTKQPTRHCDRDNANRCYQRSPPPTKAKINTVFHVPSGWIVSCPAPFTAMKAHRWTRVAIINIIRITIYYKITSIGEIEPPPLEQEYWHTERHPDFRLDSGYWLEAQISAAILCICLPTLRPLIPKESAPEEWFKRFYSQRRRGRRFTDKKWKWALDPSGSNKQHQRNDTDRALSEDGSDQAVLTRVYLGADSREPGGLNNYPMNAISVRQEIDVVWLSSLSELDYLGAMW